MPTQRRSSGHGLGRYERRDLDAACGLRERAAARRCASRRRRRRGDGPRAWRGVLQHGVRARRGRRGDAAHRRRSCSRRAVAASPRNRGSTCCSENASTLASWRESLRGYRGLVVVVSNPVDVLTHVVAASSGLPPERVIGTGTMLDTARLRQVVGQEMRVDPHSVHAQVVGEHGDSEVVLWSSAHVGGTPLRQWPGWSAERESPLATEVRTAAYEIVRRKGATNHAIGLTTAALLRSVAARRAAGAHRVARAGRLARSRRRRPLAPDHRRHCGRGGSRPPEDGARRARGARALGRGAAKRDRVAGLARAVSPSARCTGRRPRPSPTRASAARAPATCRPAS